MRIPLAILGLTSIIGSLTLMREFMAVSGGDAYAATAVLAASWLWTAMGTWLAEYRGRGVPFGRKTGGTWARPYSRTLVLVALFLPLQIVLVRATPRAWFWEWRTVGLAVLLSAPLHLMLGAQYALGRRLLEIQENVAGRAFIYQSLGIAAGGFLFAFLLRLLNVSQIALVVAAFNLVAGWWMGSFSELNLAEGMASPVYAYFLMIVAIALLALALPVGASIDQIILTRQWPDQIAVKDSNRGRTVIVRSGEDNHVYWSGVSLSGRLDDQDETIVDWALAMHARPRNLMLVGGGPAGLQMVMAKSPESIDYAEPDSATASLWLRNQPAAATNILLDPRVTLASTDARSHLQNSGRQFDLIVVNLPGPECELLNRYYTAEFWTVARQSLTPGGMLVVRFSRSDRRYSDKDTCTAGVRAAMMQYFPSVEKVTADTAGNQIFLVGFTEKFAQVEHNPARKLNLDLLPVCPAGGTLLSPLPAANLGEWLYGHGWLVAPVGFLFLLGLARPGLRIPQLSFFAALGGGGILVIAMIGMQRSLGQLYAGATDLLIAYAVGIALAGGVGRLLIGALKQAKIVLLPSAALLFQGVLIVVELGLINLLAGRLFLPWVFFGLLILAGMPVGITLALAGSRGRPGAAFVAASAGGAAGAILTGLLVTPQADMNIAGQIMLLLTLPGLVYLFRFNK